MYLVFDIGGTNTRIGVSRDGTHLGAVKMFPTRQKFTSAMDALRAAADELTRGARVRAAAGGVAGPLDRTKSKLVRGPHLPDWRGKPLRRTLARILRAPVYLENDTAMVGLGEAVKGAGRGKSIVGYLSISTGVGGCRIVDGRIDRKALGFEPGHQVIIADGKVCPGCRGRGHLEAYISGTAIRARYHKNPPEIKDKRIWDEFARRLSYGVNNLIVHWSPDIVVLGGSIMKNPGIPLPRVRLHSSHLLKIFPSIPPIVRAKLGDTGGLHGALAFLRELSNR